MSFSHFLSASIRSLIMIPSFSVLLSKEQKVSYGYDDKLLRENDNISSQTISRLYLKAPMTRRLQVDVIHPNFSAHLLMYFTHPI